MGVNSFPLAAVAVAAAAMALLSGCYYGHLAVGQTRLMWAGRPIDAVLEDSATSETLRSKLQLVRAAKHYAEELGLEVTGQYTTYLPWPGDRIVTIVVATRPTELEPAGFWFPLLGTLPYKGFFKIEGAEREASELREKGLDVCVSAVPTYSTLGWFDDPITQPMLQGSDGRLVETVVHELVHATVYAKDEPEFNESIATFIGQEAAVAFFADSDRADLADLERARVRDSRALARALGDFRGELVSLYADNADDSATEKRATERTAMEHRMREQLAELTRAGGDSGTARWAQSVRLNDACLALQGTYTGDLEQHGEVFVALGRDLGALIARLREAAKSDDVRRNFMQLAPETRVERPDQKNQKDQNDRNDRDDPNGDRVTTEERSYKAS